MRIEYKGISVSAPDFLIVGAPRCGTSTLFAYLNSHPDIFVPWEKEPMFFSSWQRPPFKDVRDHGKKLEWITSDPWDYFQLFRLSSQNQILGEASTWYLFDYAHVIPNLKSIYRDKHKDLKIMIFLRNPADRAWSHYLMYRSERREDLDFESALQPEVVASRKKQNFSLGYDYKGFGCYFAQVKAYLESFENVQIHIFEEFFSETDTSVATLYDFLGVSPPEHAADFPKTNVSGKPRGSVAGAILDIVYRPNILKTIVRPLLPKALRRPVKYMLKERLLQKYPFDPELRARLLDDYQKDVAQLERLLHRDLSLWFSGTGHGEAA